MRIGFFTSLYIPDTGGAEILLDRLARTLQKRSHHVCVVAPAPRRGHADTPYPIMRTLRPFSKRYVLHHALPPLLLAHAIHRFEILHCHGEYRAAHVARTFSRLTGVPYVIRALGGGFSTILENPELRPRAEAALAGAAGLIAQGAFLKQQMLDFGAAPDSIETIHNGVDPDELVSSGGSPPRAAPYIFYVGGLRHVKGWDVLIKAFADVAETVAPVQLVLAGNNQQEAEFRQLCSDLGLTKGAVDYAGLLSRQEMALQYRHALFYVCPFRKSPFSNANLEAMTAGLPVLATAVDGNIEQIRHEREGLLVPADDPGALAAGLKRLCCDDAFRERCAEQARQRAQEFTWSKMVDRYEHFYNNVLRSVCEKRRKQ